MTTCRRHVPTSVAEFYRKNRKYLCMFHCARFCRGDPRIAREYGWPFHLTLRGGRFRNRPYMGYRDPDCFLLSGNSCGFVSTIGRNFLLILIIISTYSRNFSEIVSMFRLLVVPLPDYPKYIVTMEDITVTVQAYLGINHIHLRDFLKMDF